VKPYYSDDTVTLWHGANLDVLPHLETGSVDCVVTSPPYYSLRDYGVDGQYGNEPSPAEFIGNLVATFREVRRVMAHDATLWLNLGDSYAQSGKSGPQGSTGQRADRTFTAAGAGSSGGLPPKSLMLMPHRVAMALQDDGWILRNAVVWEKPNAMPESVTDRLSTRYEMLFLFSKGKTTGPDVTPMSDVDAAWLAALIDGEGSITINRSKRSDSNPNHVDVFGICLSVANTSVPLLEKAARLMGDSLVKMNNSGANRPCYSVQVSDKKAARVIRRIRPFLIDKAEQARVALALVPTQRSAGVPTSAYKGTAARAYKERLWLAVKSLNQREPIDLSWVVDEKPTRTVPQPYWFDLDSIREDHKYGAGSGQASGVYSQGSGRNDSNTHGSGGFVTLNAAGRNPGDVWTITTTPFTGAHFAAYPPELARRCIVAGCKPGGTVLDPFHGSGTTGMVAQKHGRKYIGIELNREYLDLSLRTRLANAALDFEEPV